MLQVIFYPILTCKGGRQTNSYFYGLRNRAEHMPGQAVRNHMLF